MCVGVCVCVCVFVSVSFIFLFSYFVHKKQVLFSFNFRETY